MCEIAVDHACPAGAGLGALSRAREHERLLDDGLDNRRIGVDQLDARSVGRNQDSGLGDLQVRADQPDHARVTAYWRQAQTQAVAGEAGRGRLLGWKNHLDAEAELLDKKGERGR